MHNDGGPSTSRPRSVRPRRNPEAADGAFSVSPSASEGEAFTVSARDIAGGEGAGAAAGSEALARTAA